MEKKSLIKRFWWLGILIIIPIIIMLTILNSKGENEVNQMEAEDFLKQPEERISVALPFAPEDDAIGIAPVGETINHPVAGHPGIDFGWKHKAPVRASADGVVTALPDSGKGNGEIGLVLRSGQYLFEYGSLGEYEKNIKIGSIVKQGDILGYPLSKGDGQDYAIHWEIKPAYQNSERLCPMTYFNPDSKARIDKIWATHDKGMYAKDFPDICNGKWKNLNSFEDILKWINSPEKIKADKAIDKYKEANSNQ
jgi:murein DD-endopeptidase MepM/ murein hydrolase activator NlpD